MEELEKSTSKPTESRFPRRFDKCPKCGKEETAAKEAIKPYQLIGQIEAGAFASITRVSIPLLQPKLAGMTAPILVAHYDICMNCGENYCTKVEIVNKMVQVVQGLRGRPNQRRLQ